MTQIKIFYKGNIIYGFHMKGHAEFNTKGPDILCASLSTASQMTINGVLDWMGLDVDECIKENDPRQASLLFDVDVVPERVYSQSVVQQLFRSFEMYVEQLSEQYKEYVTLERRQKDDM